MLNDDSTAPQTGQAPRSASEQESDQSTMVANAGGLLASRLITAALGWGGTLLIARSLSIDEFGRFTLVFTVLGLMSVVTDMGVGRLAVRGILGGSGREPGDFAGAYVVLRSLMGVAGYLVALGVVWGLGYPREVVVATAVAGCVVLVATPSAAFDAIFQARMRLGTVSTANVVGLSSQLALTAAIAAGGGSLLLFTLPAVLCAIVQIAWKWSVARRILAIRYHVDVVLWRGMLREALPLTLGFGLATVYYRIDALMLSQLDTFESVGIYGVSYKFIDVIHYAAVAVTTPLLTLLVTAWPHDVSAYRAALRRGTTLLALIGGLALTGLLGYARPVTDLLYGAEYAVGEHATRVLAVSQMLTIMIALALTALVAMGQHRQYPWIMLGGLLLNVALNLVLVPRYSYEGAAAATLATEVVVLAVMLVTFARVGKVGPLPLGGLVRMAVAVAAALGVARLIDVGLPGLPWWIAATISCTTYLLVALLIGLWRASGLPMPRPRREAAIR